MRALLALDQGSHASRAVLFDAAGNECASAARAVATSRRGSAVVEHDAAELLESLRAAAADALGQLRRRHAAVQIVAAGLATQRSTFVACARDTLAPLAPAISWQDRRNAAWLAGLEAQAARVRALTGLPLSAHYGASKMRWCLDHVAAVAAAAAHGGLLLLPLAAWLAGRLTGRVAVDPANAARTLLWDSATLDWSAELCALFGIERACLPPCGPTRQRFGELRIEQLAVPLTACTGDQSAVPYAWGTPDPHSAYINLGTGAFVQRPLAARPAAPEPLLGSVLAVEEHAPLYSLEGSVNGAGAAVSWYARSTGVDEHHLWPLLDTLADDAALPLFVNGVGGLGSPWWRSAEHAVFIGSGSVAERFAAVLESIAFLIAENLRLMAQQGGSLHHVIVTGGLARSDWLCRRLAAVIALPVERRGHEASARGTAALAAPECARSWSAATQSRRFTPAAPAGLSERQTRWQRALSQL
jgi:glycerol kinase